MTHSPRDLWGWPKIPFLHTLPQDDSSHEDNPWRAVSNDANFSYSSLIDNILSKVPADRRAEFPLETSYFAARCHRLVANMPSNEAFHKLGGEHWLMHNASTLWNLPASSTGSLESNFFIDTSYNFSYPESPNSSVNLLYGSVDGVPTPGNNAAIFNCSISLVCTESWIDCTNATCAVTRMRLSEKNEPLLNPYHEMDYWKVRTLISEFPHATGPIDSLTSSLTEGYIYGDPLHDYASGFREWEDINEADMSTRLTTELNTYWQATSNVTSIQSTSISGTKYLNSLNGTNATTFKDVQVYGVSSAWLTVFIISTVILQVSAVASLLLKFITVAPNILGYVSSLTRENPYTPLPAGGSGLGGMERSHLLQDLHVQIAGVSEHGHGDGYLDATRVALVSRDSESKLQIQDLRQGQQYL